MEPIGRRWLLLTVVTVGLSRELSHTADLPHSPAEPGTARLSL